MSTSPEQPGNAPEPAQQAESAQLAQSAPSATPTQRSAASSTAFEAVVPESETPAIPVIPPHVNKEIFHSALRATLVMLVVLAVAGVGIGAIVAGTAGVWGALLGVAVALLFSGSTILSMLYTADKSPNTTMAVLLGVWIGKMVVLIAVMTVLGELDFYHRVVFAVIVLVGVVGSAGLDLYSVVKGREPYITPR